LTLTQVAQRLGMTEPSVGERLRRSGYEMRPGSRKPRTSTSELARLYFDEGSSLVQVGARGRPDPKGRLHPAAIRRLSTLARLYFDEGLTLAQVAARVGATAQTVRLHLAEAGYPTASTQPVM